MNMEKKFVKCAYCGNTLMEVMDNGCWYFRFGKKSKDSKEPIVEMTIHGAVKMRLS